MTDDTQLYGQPPMYGQGGSTQPSTAQGAYHYHQVPPSTLTGTTWAMPSDPTRDKLVNHYEAALEAERLECQRLREECHRLRTALGNRAVPAVDGVTLPEVPEEVLAAVLSRSGGSLDNQMALNLLKYASERRGSAAPEQIAREILNGGDDDE